jgi:hypothetical protein
MKPHEQRVLVERAELLEKTEKLRVFINNSEIYRKMGTYAQFLLCRQLEHMQNYMMILDLRIAMFPKDEG